MEKRFFLQNDKGLFLTNDNTFVFAFPDENLKRFSSKNEAEEEIKLYPNENLIVRKLLSDRKIYF
jgi:hypothetical protein